MRRHSLFFALALLSALTAACSDQMADANSASAVAVFSYEDEDSAPDARMAVFVQLNSDRHKAASLKIQHSESKQVWDVRYPLAFDGSSRGWAGCANIRAADGERIPSGSYTVEYEDMAGETDSASFSLRYPESLAGKTLQAVLQDEAASYRKRVALYNARDELVFCDARRKAWKSKDDVRKDFPDAQKFRRMLLSQDGMTALLLPLRSIEEFSEDE